jgi:hypothetical protein
MSDRLLDAKAIAEKLGVSETWVRESARSGAMPCIRLGADGAGVLVQPASGLPGWLSHTLCGRALA